MHLALSARQHAGAKNALRSLPYASASAPAYALHLQAPAPSTCHQTASKVGTSFAPPTALNLHYQCAHAHTHPKYAKRCKECTRRCVQMKKLMALACKHMQHACRVHARMLARARTSTLHACTHLLHTHTGAHCCLCRACSVWMSWRTSVASSIPPHAARFGSSGSWPRSRCGAPSFVPLPVLRCKQLAPALWSVCGAGAAVAGCAQHTLCCARLQLPTASGWCTHACAGIPHRRTRTSPPFTHMLTRARPHTHT